MSKPSLGWIVTLASFAASLAIRCTDLTVNRTSDGTTSAVASGPDAPPIEIDEEGIHEWPTPTPGPHEPVYPVTPPAPTRTPRPR